MFKRFQRNKSVDEPTPFIISETIEPEPAITPEDVQLCASCNAVGAMHAIAGGDFYLGRLTVRLCDVCHKARVDRSHMHHVAQKRTLLEHQITTPIPRTPSKPLERAYNLAEV